MFYVNFGDFQVSGSSPEILVRVRGGVVTVRPIAGTLPRGRTADEDAANEERLLADPKERAEHLMLLDLGRNDVGRVAARGTVEVTESFTVERYSHVMHIVSNVQGRLKEGEDMVSALAAGFPAGTTSGAPKIRAMEIITELEPHARGVYAGGVGYFGALLGSWLAGSLGLPAILVITIGGSPVPVVWSILGGALFVALLGMLTRRRIIVRR
jgi:anthranilate synthase component 1